MPVDTTKKPPESLTVLEMWSVFFKFAPDPKHRDFVNEIIQINEEVGMASALLMEISKDEDERARLMSRKKYEMDLYSNLAAAERRGEERGEKEGEKRGEKKKAREIAKDMKADGYATEVIAKFTKLESVNNFL